MWKGNDIKKLWPKMVSFRVHQFVWGHKCRFERCGIVSHNYANWQLVRYPPKGEVKWIDAWRHKLGKPFHVCWHRKNEREEAVISVAIIYVKHSKRRHCITPIFQEKGANLLKVALQGNAKEYFPIQFLSSGLKRRALSSLLLVTSWNWCQIFDSRFCVE